MLLFGVFRTDFTVKFVNSLCRTCEALSRSDISITLYKIWNALFAFTVIALQNVKVTAYCRLVMSKFHAIAMN